MKRWSSVRYLLPALVCVLGLSWAAPVAAGQKAEIQFMKADGTVNVVSPGGRVLQRYANMQLCSGYQIQAEEDGSAWIGLGSEEQVRLDAGSRMEVRTAGGAPEFLLDAGSLYFHMNGDSQGRSLGIRTASAAVHIQKASGRICTVDRRRTLVCLQEGTLQCSVTDPVTGQVKHAVVSAGQQAECVVYLQDQDGERCDILLSGCEAEETGISAVDEQKAKRSEALEAAAQKSLEYAGIKDPVWEGGLSGAVLVPETKPEDSREEKASGLASFEAASKDAAGNGSSLRIPKALQTPQMQQVPVTPVQVEMAVLEEESRPFGSSSGKRKPSSSAPSREPEIQTPVPVVPSEPETPGTPSVPAEPETPVQGELTENKGLVVDGVRIAKNGPDGIIEVREGGRITFADASVTLYNEGTITNAGIVDGAVCNETGSILTNTGTINGDCTVDGGEIALSSGSVTRIVQKDGLTKISGGAVTDGCAVFGGSFRMTGGTVNAGSAGAALELNVIRKTAKEARPGSAEHAQISVTGGTVFGNGTGKRAIQLENGNLLLAKDAAVKAQNVFDTFSGSDNGSWEVHYGESIVQSGGPAAIYVTQTDTDEMMHLRNLETDFARVAQAENGDIISLSGDTKTTAVSGTYIKALGGTEEAPVTLDLNDRTLTIMNTDSSQSCLQFLSGSTWDITKGKIKLPYMDSWVDVEDHSKVTMSEVEIPDGGHDLYIGEYSNLSISNCNTQGFDIYNKNYSNLTVSKSSIGHLDNSDNSIAVIEGSEMGSAVNYDSSTLSISEGSTIGRNPEDSIVNSGSSTLSISDSRTGAEGIDKLINEWSECTISRSRIVMTSDGVVGTLDNKFTLVDSDIVLANKYASVVQQPLIIVNGTFEMTGGTAEGGCRVDESGVFRMTDGILTPGMADAALTLSGGRTQIDGSTISGGEDGRIAVQMYNGWVQMDAETVIKAKNAVDTVKLYVGSPARMADENGWRFQYGADIIKQDALPTIYVTKEDETDGMMCLKHLDTDFSRVADAQAGDVITLSEDVACDSVVTAKGGTEEFPVVLDLNGKKLNVRVMTPDPDRIVLVFSSAVWSIKNRDHTRGELSAKYGYRTDKILIDDSSNVSMDSFKITGNLSIGEHCQVAVKDAALNCTNGIEISRFCTVGISGTEITASGYNSGPTQIISGKRGDTERTNEIQIDKQSVIKGNCRIENYNGEIVAADSTIDITDDIINWYSAKCLLSQSVIKARNINNASEYPLPTRSDGVIWNSSVCTISGCENVEVDHIENDGGTYVFSDSNIKGKISNQRGDCTLSNCNMDVTGSGISAGSGRLCIEGGTYKTDAASGMQHLISCSNNINADVHMLKIGGGADLNTSGKGIIPVCVEGKGSGNLEIIFEQATICGGEKPALKGVFTADGSDSSGIQTLKIREGADFSSNCQEGTIVLESVEDVPTLMISLSGGCIRNEGTGPALNLSSFDHVSGEIFTEMIPPLKDAEAVKEPETEAAAGEAEILPVFEEVILDSESNGDGEIDHAPGAEADHTDIRGQDAEI